MTRIVILTVLVAAVAVSSSTARGKVAQTAAGASRIPRMPDGEPNFTGLWQYIGTANWDLQDHSAQPGPFHQLGAIGAIPAGQGIVQGNEK
jgi:hypothetical protein